MSLDGNGHENGNGLSVPSLETRVELLEDGKADRSEVAALRRDMERTWRVLLEVQVEARNHFRQLMDKFEVVERKK